MKTAWLLVLVMAVAASYVFDVGGSRRPLDDARAYISEQAGGAADAVRERLPEAARP